MGKNLKKNKHMYMYNQSLCYIPEANTTFVNHYTPILKKDNHTLFPLASVKILL